MCNSKARKLIFSIASVAIAFSVVVLSLLLIWESSYKVNGQSTHPVQLTGTYTVEGQEGERPLPVDYAFDLSGYSKLTINGHFSREIPANEQLMMRIDNMRIRLSVNGKIIYTFGEEGTIPPQVRSAGNVWQSMVSPGIQPGDAVTLELENVYVNHVETTFHTFLSNLYVGYESQLMIQELSSSLLNSFISGFILCMGLISVAFAFVLFRMKRSVLPTLSFSCLSIFSGIWFFINFNVQSFYVPFPIFNNGLDIASLVLTAAFLMIYFAVTLKNKRRILLLFEGVSCFVLAIVAGAAQILGWRDYYDFAGVVELISLVFVVSIVYCLVREWRTVPSQSSKWLILCSSFVCVGIVADIICNFFEIIPYMIWFKIGFFLFMFFQLFQMARSIQQMMSEGIQVQTLREQSSQQARVLEYQNLLTEATRGLYESIYELDLTHNCAGGETTRQYFESLDIPGNTPAGQALHQIASKQIKPEHRKAYLDTFLPPRALDAYEKGQKSLSCEFMIAADGKSYYWMRITARMFYWEEDHSVRMIVYRENIDAEKKHEKLFQYQQLLTQTTNGLYENVFEFDLTHNCAGGESTVKFFESLDLSAHTPYDKALFRIAERQIKEEDRQGYIDTFTPDRVLALYASGVDQLSYEFRCTNDHVHYYWTRISARLFYWNEDHSVRMISYRENIDEEKQQLFQLAEQAKRDPMTNLYNKAATHELIAGVLHSSSFQNGAFFILDIDDFKHVNDSLGHAFGDFVITEFARELKSQFRADDIVGRVGGDEFAVFLQDFPARQWVDEKAASLQKNLCRQIEVDGMKCRISASIGVALAPEHGADFESLYKNADIALYHTKARSKNGFTVYHDPLK